MCRRESPRLFSALRRPVEIVPPHFGQIAFPLYLPEELRKAAHLLNANCLFERFVDGGRISLESEDAGRLLQKFLVKHKICTLHVYSVAAVDVLAESTLPANG